jgi:hypothetical protein
MMWDIVTSSSSDPTGSVAPFSRLQQVVYASLPIGEPQKLGADGFEHIQALFALPAIEHINITLDTRSFPGWPP